MNEENIENKIKEINLSAIKDVIVDFVFPIIGLGITAVLFFVYIKPTYAKVNELKQQVTEQTAVLEVLNTKAAALTKMKVQSRTFRSSWTRYIRLQLTRECP